MLYATLEPRKRVNSGGDGHRNTHRDAGREDKVAVVNARGHAGGGVGGAAETA